MADPLAERLAAWRVVPTGPELRTPTSRIRFGERDGRPVVLKVAPDEEERRGARLLAWWAGRGAVAVLERDGDAVLLARATGPRDLAAMSREGRDAEATAVLARAAARLHANGVPAEADGVGLLPLATWFAALLDRPHADPVLARCAVLARRLLAATADEDVVALHGDVHHGNVLDTGDGWAAIDPKGLLGHRAFDYGNVCCNPEPRPGGPDAAALLPGRLAVIAAEAAIDPVVLAGWVAAWCGLSLAWGSDRSSWHGRATRLVAERLLRDPALGLSG